jgi:hypothetical protein
LGKGLVRVAADPSLVINSMVDASDNAAFLRYLTSRGGEPSAVYIDNGHLTQTTLDRAKLRLAGLRSAVSSSPQLLLGIVAAAMALTAALTYRKPQATA